MCIWITTGSKLFDTPDSVPEKKRIRKANFKKRFSREQRKLNKYPACKKLKVNRDSLLVEPINEIHVLNDVIIFSFTLEIIQFFFEYGHFFFHNMRIYQARHCKKFLDPNIC